MPSKSRFDVRIPAVLLATAAAASLALVGCGGDDGDREAAGTPGYVVDGNTGNAADNKTYRGVELTVENNLGADMKVSFAGYCRRQTTGTNGWRTLKQGEKARWRSCDKIVYGRYPEQFSAMQWPGIQGAYGRERFQVENPALQKPTFFFNEKDCFHPTVNDDIIGGMGQNETVRVENKSKNCGAAVVVKRESDSADYIRFYATVKPQG